MFLSLSITRSPATDLGFLLHKHPDRLQEFTVPTGVARVFYPVAEDANCTMCFWVDVDTVKLAKGRGVQHSFALGQYVNDRPYAASSLLASALAKVFSSALKGQCRERPELVTEPFDVTVTLPTLPDNMGGELTRRLWEPLGWQVNVTSPLLDEEWPQWGQAPYVHAEFTGRHTIQSVLQQLYVLLPVADDAKHYWVDQGEVTKLVQYGGDWLPNHPEQQLITRRYLAHQATLARSAESLISQMELADTPPPAPTQPVPEPLRVARTNAIVAQLKQFHVKHVLDLGCGEGNLVRTLLESGGFTKIVGADVSARELDRATSHLKLRDLPESQADIVSLIQASVTYDDDRFAEADAIVLQEVVEHIDPERLPTVERVIFGHAKPKVVVLTTPNQEYNTEYAGLAPGEVRHSDHRFEWTRTQCQQWAEHVANNYGYQVQQQGVGEERPQVGCPTTMVTFTRVEKGQK